MVLRTPRLTLNWCLEKNVSVQVRSRRAEQTTVLVWSGERYGYIYSRADRRTCVSIRAGVKMIQACSAGGAVVGTSCAHVCLNQPKS